MKKKCTHFIQQKTDTCMVITNIYYTGGGEEILNNVDEVWLKIDIFLTFYKAEKSLLNWLLDLYTVTLFYDI